MVKRADDARYLKSEGLIITAAAKLAHDGRRVTVTKICEQAGIFISTFYRHFRGINEMLEACNEMLAVGLEEILTEAKRNELSLEQIFQQWAFFLYRHQDLFCLVTATGGMGVALVILEHLRPLAVMKWRSSPEVIEYIYLIFSYEVMGIWMRWAKREKFNIDKIPGHARELDYLARTALQRLGGLAEIDGRKQ